jgi:hypothetical protein
MGAAAVFDTAAATPPTVFTVSKELNEGHIDGRLDDGHHN